MCPPAELDVYEERLNEAISSDNLIEYADSYLDVLRYGREESCKIVDKLPDNYLFLGFIHALFPNARIIHAYAHRSIPACPAISSSSGR